MLTQDDVIYFVVTDRFRNGDTGNDSAPPGVDKTHSGRFHGGDFPGLLESLPYLRQLGVTAIWITPVYASIGRLDDGSSDGFHGYWALAFDRIDPILHASGGAHPSGARAYLADLAAEIHEQGMKLVLDVVVNHTGYHNETYLHSPGRLPASYFNRDGKNEFDVELAGLPDLDHDQSDVVDFFIENLLDWIEQTGIDAIRMDTAKHVEDKFWHFYKAQVKGAFPKVTLLGEVLNFTVADVARYQTLHDFDTLFDFPLRGALLAVFVWDASAERLARPRVDDPREVPGILDEDNPKTDGYSNANRLVTLLDNHDLDRRIMSEARLRFPGTDRTNAVRLVKLCLSFLFTTRGIPQLYYGTELGLEGFKVNGTDHLLRGDFPWSVIGADLRPTPGTVERDLYDHTHRLIEIRRRHAALRYGVVLTVYVDAFIYASLRYHRNDCVVTVINNGHAPMTVPLPLPIGANSNIPTRVKNLLEGKKLVDLLDSDVAVECRDGIIDITVPGKSCRVLTPAT